MEKIIIKLKNAQEAKEVLELLRKMNVDAEVYQNEPIDEAREKAKEEILDSVERGMQEVKDYKAGRIKLKDAKSLLDEL